MRFSLGSGRWHLPLNSNPSALTYADYSNFGIGVDRKNTAKWRFPQENGTFRCAQEVYVYSEIALNEGGSSGPRAGGEEIP